MNKIKLDKYHAHEALDRAYLSLDQFDEYVANHPFISQIPHLKEHADAVIDIMGKMYQLIGTEIHNNYESND